MGKAKKKAAKKVAGKATGRSSTQPTRRAAAKKKAKKKASRRVARPPISAPKKKAPAARAGSGAGRPPFEPTPELRKQVEAMASTGALRQDQIALLVINPETGKPVSLNTLRRHFPHELATAAAKANSMVAQSLFQQATGTGGVARSTTAGIWWEKTRTGMKERQVVEVETKSGVLVSPASATPEEWIAEAARKAAGAKEPGASADPG